MDVVKLKQVKFLENKICMSVFIRLVYDPDNLFCKMKMLRRFVSKLNPDLTLNSYLKVERPLNSHLALSLHPSPMQTQ